MVIRAVSTYAAIFVMMVMSAIVVIYVWLGTSSGASFLEHRINQFAYNEASGGIRIEGLQGPLPGTVKVTSIHVSDANGIWLIIDHAEIDTNISALLRRTVDIRTIKASRVSMLRKPEYPKTTTQADSDKGGLPYVPRIIIDELIIPEIIVSDTVTGNIGATLSIQAEADIYHDHVVMHGALHTLEGTPLSADFHISIDKDIDIDVSFSEDPGGLLAVSTGLDPKNGLSGTIRAQGNIDAFEGEASFKEGDRSLARIDIKRQSQTLVINGAGQWPSSMVSRFSSIGSGWNIGVVGSDGNDGSFVLSDETHLTTDAIVFKASGIFLPKSRDVERLDIFADIKDINALVNAAGSSAVASGSVQAQVYMKSNANHWHVSPRLSSQKIILNGKIIDGIMINGDMDIAVDDTITIHGPVDITAGFEGTPLNAGFIIQADTKKIIHADEIRLSTPYGSAGGDVSYDVRNQHIDTSLTTERLSLNNFIPDNALNAYVTSHMRAEGTPTDIYVRADADITDIKGLPVHVERFVTDKARLTMKARIKAQTSITLETLSVVSGNAAVKGKGAWPLSTSAPPSSLALTLSHEGYEPITFNADMLPKKTHIMIPSLLLKCANTAVTGELKLAPSSLLPSGTLRLKSTEAKALMAWAGIQEQRQPVTYENIVSDITLRTEKGVLSTDIMTKLSGVVIADKDTRIAQMSIDAVLTNVKKPDTLLVKTDINGLRQGSDILLSRISVVSRGKQKQHTFDTLHDWNMEGIQAQQGLWVKGSTGVVLSDAGDVTVNATLLQGDIAGFPFRLDREATIIRRADGVLSVKDVSLSSEASRLTAEGSLDVDQVTMNGILSLSDVGTLPGLKTRNIPQTSVNGRWKISGTPASPNVVINATASAEAVSPGLPGMEAKGDISWERDTIALDMRADAGSAGADMSLSMPASLSLQPFAFSFKDTSALAGKIRISAPFQDIQPFLRASGHEILGALDADINIGGTVATPSLQGEAQWKGGAYKHLIYGVCLEDASLKVSFTDTFAAITELSAKGSGGKGSLTGKGDANWEKQTISSALTLSSVELFCSGLAKGTIAGDIRLDGTFKDLLAKGNLVLGPLEMTIPGGGISDIPSVEIIQPKKDHMPQKASGGSMIALDMNISAPGRIFVRGRGLDAEFKGDLAVKGTADLPIISGSLETQRGKFAALGRTLTIQEGKISFTGSNPPIPYLNISTSTDTGDNVAVGLNLEGPVTKPDISLSSEPALPDDDALARLLFGKQLSEITPMQALKLAQAVATLTGKGGFGGGGLLDNVRGALGVDTLDIDTGGAEGPTVGAGKYITDKIFVGIEQGAQPENRRVKTEIEIIPGINAETSTDGAGNTSSGIEWRWDY